MSRYRDDLAAGMLRHDARMRAKSRAENSVLRRRIASLERLQAQRIELVAEKTAAMDLLVADKQLEIENLRAQVTIA